MLLDMFITFFKIGAFTFGGGYAMLPIIQREVVDKKNWICDEEFMDALAIAQASPGPVAVNTSIYVGHRLKGVSGAIACLLGTVMPSFLTILIIAMFFYQFREYAIIDKIFMGIRPAVAALITAAVYGLMKKSKFTYDKLAISLLTILIITIFKISPIWLVIAGAIGSVVYYKLTANN